MEYKMRHTSKAIMKVVQKYNENGNPMGYFYFLNGFGFCYLASSNNDRHDYKLAIDEIHDYYAKRPKANVKTGYRAGVSYSIRLIHDKQTLQNVFDYLNYEFEKQKNGTASFALDYKDVLVELKNELVKKADLLRNEYSNFDYMVKVNLEELERKSWERR